MRGALPDAECARCGARFPPSFESPLVTCAKCGLVFTPHDVQRPHRRALVASRESTALSSQPTIANLGDGVQLVITPERFLLSKRIDRSTGMIALAVGAIAGQFIAPWLLLVGFAAALPFWFTRRWIEIAGDHVTIRQRPIPLGADETFPLADLVTLDLVAVSPGANPRFDLHAVLSTGSHVHLLRAVSRPTADAAVGWLTQRLAFKPVVG